MSFPKNGCQIKVVLVVSRAPRRGLQCGTPNGECVNGTLKNNANSSAVKSAVTNCRFITNSPIGNKADSKSAVTDSDFQKPTATAQKRYAYLLLMFQRILLIPAILVAIR